MEKENIRRHICSEIAKKTIQELYEIANELHLEEEELIAISMSIFMTIINNHMELTEDYFLGLCKHVWESKVEEDF